MTSPRSALTTILDRTALMWLSCLSSLSSTSSSSKVTRLALKRDFFGGAGVKGGSWSGRSTGSVKGQPRSYNVNPFFFFYKCKQNSLPSMVTTSLSCASSFPFTPPPPSPLLLSGLRTTVAAAGAPEVRNCCCSLRRSSSESVGWGRCNILPKDTIW